MRFLGKNFKNVKFFYYLKNYLLLIIPNFFFHKTLEKRLSNFTKNEIDNLIERVNYYNKIDSEVNVDSTWSKLSDLKIKKKGKTYFFDAYSISRNFSPKFKCNFLFGDIDYVPNKPSFVKSRPINNSQNSILLKLNRIRHFQYVVDNIKLENKADILFGRAAVFQKQRIDFYNKYFNHPMCDLGQINSGTNHDQWLKKKASLDTHLKHKFILCIEGNDVASNLKWVMSSNSVAVMPKPKHESWFMEGKLIPNYHYILIKDDYSDLQEKLNYYKKNTDELKRIAKNANQYTNQFRDINKEKLISLLVMEKFFKLSNQKKSSVNFLT
ncbi:MAG: glycosyl transferase family 90 [Bacteroidota bacterium]|nr:glycosyl transferase family 90 [Bacteroidota bacterium]